MDRRQGSRGLFRIVCDVDVIRVDGSRSRTYVSATSERTFRFVVTRLQEPVEIELLAGDYRTRVPYRIEVVNPPGIDSVQLLCTYPEYTGWNQLRERTLTITGSEVQLPIGTSFELVATSSKPLQEVTIVSDQFKLSGDRDSSPIVDARCRDGGELRQWAFDFRRRTNDHGEHDDCPGTSIAVGQRCHI